MFFKKNLYVGAQGNAKNTMKTLLIITVMQLFKNTAKKV